MYGTLRYGSLVIGWTGIMWACCAPFAAVAQEPPPGEPLAVYVRPAPPPLAPPPSEATSAFTFSVGWARLEGDGDSLIDGEDGYYFDTDFAFRPNTDSPLWFGISFNGSYFEEEEDVEVDGGVFPTEVDVGAQLSNFAIEPRLTVVLLPRQDRGVYLAGRLGVGLLITDYWATTVVERPGGFFVESDGDTVAAFEVRPGLQLGFSGGAWVLGLEASNMWAWGDFGPVGDQIEERRVGIFFTLRH